MGLQLYIFFFNCKKIKFFLGSLHQSGVCHNQSYRCTQIYNWYLAFGIWFWFLVFGFWNLVFGVWYLVLDILYFGIWYRYSVDSHAAPYWCCQAKITNDLILCSLLSNPLPNLPKAVQGGVTCTLTRPLDLYINRNLGINEEE